MLPGCQKPGNYFLRLVDCRFISDLAARQCVPCSSKDIWAMSEHSAKELLEKSELGVYVYGYLTIPELFRTVQ